MSEEDNGIVAAALTALLDDRFAGHPYTWDYNTKCSFLLLDCLCREEFGVLQEHLIVNCGFWLVAPGYANDALRATKISLNKRLELQFIGVGNGDTRVHLFASTQHRLVVERFMARGTHVLNREYLLRSLESIPNQYL
jgi:hypothetical protein